MEHLAHVRGALCPVLLCINHPNNLIDSLLVGAVLPRKVHYLATAALFRNPLTARFLVALGVIPALVHRGRSAMIIEDVMTSGRAMNCVCGHPERAHMDGGRCRVPDCPCERFERATRYLRQSYEDGPSAAEGALEHLRRSCAPQVWRAHSVIVPSCMRETYDAGATDFIAGVAGPMPSSLRISRRLTTSTRTR